MTFAQFGKNEEPVVGFLFDAQIVEGQLAHAVAKRHEGAFVSVKFKGPFRGNVLRFHFAISFVISLSQRMRDRLHQTNRSAARTKRYLRSVTRSCAPNAHMIRPRPALIILVLTFMLILAPRLPPMRTAMPVTTIKGMSKW